MLSVLTRTAIILCACICCQRIYAQVGSLDPDFGFGGIFIGTLPTASSVKIADAVVQSDKKVVAMGYCNTGTQSNPLYQLVVIRLLANGSFDNSFNSNGYQIVNFGIGSTSQGFAIVLQSDGKIIVGGTVYKNNNADFVLARLNSNGTLDDTFGANGKVFTDFGSQFSEEVHDLILQTDGKIVAVGQGGGFDSKLTMARYLSNGSLDNSFGSAGKVFTQIMAGFSCSATSIAQQADGKLVVGASLSGIDNSEALVFRYQANGALDITFNGSGYIFYTPYQLTTVTSVKVQNDGKIVAGGSYYSPNGATSGMFLFRLTAAGIFDNEFGTTGKLLLPNTTISSIGLQTDGKIVTAGSRFNDFALGRFTQTGFLDNTFGNAGFKIIDLNSTSEDIAFALEILPDGKFIVAGSSDNSFAITRHYGSAQALPVMLQEFSVAQYSKQVFVRWKTASEINVEEFIVQHKGETGSFKTVGRVQANGNSSYPLTYSFVDQIFSSLGSSTVFYRLVIKDINGAETYSSIKTLKLGIAESSLRITPNPVSRGLILSFGSNSTVKGSVKIFNSAGNIVFSKEVQLVIGRNQLD
ncbi:MAG: hypothetical protein EOP48_12030, partial [Sphingobacteriales bacterium]